MKIEWLGFVLIVLMCSLVQTAGHGSDTHSESPPIGLEVIFVATLVLLVPILAVVVHIAKIKSPRMIATMYLLTALFVLADYFIQKNQFGV